ncbi:MAG TPA: hypothetical protein VGE96_07100 [Steroidobacteraceae bacterium]|jgi:hypothetical protein
MRYLIAITAVSLAACSASPGPGGLTQKADDHSICDQAHFPDFLSSFAEDVQVQRKHTEFPLHKREFRHVTTQVDPVPVESVVKESDVRFPVYPSPSDQRARSLTAQVASQSGRNAEVRVSREDTDYLVVYSFEHTSCWKLTRVEDRSQ